MNRNSSSRGSVAVIVLSIIAGVMLVSGLGYVSFSNTCNRYENGLKAVYTNNQNIYSQGFSAVKEMAQVPKAYMADLEKLYAKVVEGREGSGQELFRFIQEANPTVDTAMYVKVQQKIEAFRLDFQAGQKELISHRQEYENYLTGTMAGTVYNGFAGYPHVDLDKFKVVTSDVTQEVFGAGKETAPMNVFN